MRVILDAPLRSLEALSTHLVSPDLDLPTGGGSTGGGSGSSGGSSSGSAAPPPLDMLVDATGARCSLFDGFGFSQVTVLKSLPLTLS